MAVNELNPNTKTGLQFEPTDLWKVKFQTSPTSLVQNWTSKFPNLSKLPVHQLLSVMFDQIWAEYSGQIFALFILCKEAKIISKSLRRKRRNCERKNIENSNWFKFKLKDLIIYFKFPLINQKYSWLKKLRLYIIKR